MYGISRLLFSEGCAGLGNVPAMYVIMNPVFQTFYVGSTTKIEKRITQHIHCLKRGIHSNKYLQSDFNQLWDPQSVFMIIIQFYETVADAMLAEQEYLNSHYLNPRCLNILGIAHGKGRSGSDNVSKTLSESDKYKEHYKQQTAGVIEYVQSECGRRNTSENSKKMWRKDGYREKWLNINGDSVIVDGVTYGSVREASRKTGVSILTIRSRMVDNNSVSIVNIRKPSKRVSIRGVVYNTLNDAARAEKVKANTITWRCQNESLKWRDHFYIDDE